jgi:hypothetical protein
VPLAMLKALEAQVVPGAAIWTVLLLGRAREKLAMLPPMMWARCESTGSGTNFMIGVEVKP